MIEKLFKKSIFWLRHPTEERFFYCYFDDELILLRMNNFPDEPLYTLIKGLEIVTFDDVPEIWILPT